MTLYANKRYKIMGNDSLHARMTADATIGLEDQGCAHCPVPSFCWVGYNFSSNLPDQRIHLCVYHLCQLFFQKIVTAIHYRV